MIPLYVSDTKIYHFSTNFLQFEQISGLKPIDSKSDMWGLLVSADMKKKSKITLKVNKKK
jgi:hypothetical protein